ncbi:MAG: ATP-dependent helicase [Oscillospiraceae bacterium]|nr:ATP-dependent helicase [Oscillospiraceae bacterium]
MDYAEFKEKYALRLSAQQERAVQAIDGYNLLLAVPGSGKTTVLVTRLGNMVYCRGIEPKSILTMTYTVAATRDMRDRFESFFGPEYASQLEFRTINGVSARIIRHYENTTGSTAFQLLSDDQSVIGVLAGIYREVAKDYATEAELKNIRAKITYVKNMMLGREEIDAIEKEIRHFPDIYARYEAYLKNSRLMDYDDQMVYALRILRRYPDILDYFTSRYRYICVDEAQDTSKIQHTIIRLLASRSGNLFMVGDEDQSIYGFRAAYPDALVSFGSLYPGASILLMEKNYRSTSEIVAAADRFIARNKDRHEKHMTADRSEACPIQEIPVASRYAQYRLLAETAQNCTTETAVLYRDNDSAIPLIDLLDRSNTGYRCRQVDSLFFTHRTIRELREIIDFARDQTNGLLFRSLYYKLDLKLTKAEMERAIANCPEDRSILDYIADDYRTSMYVARNCRAMRTHMKNMFTESADKAIYRIVNFMGYGEYLASRDMDSSKMQILEILGRQEKDLDGLLRRLDELKDIVARGTSDPNSRFVLSTIHSSKGLEYDRVYLADVYDGLLPSVGPESDQYEEECRLFYVGMTRARNELYLFTFSDRAMFSTFTAIVLNKLKEPKKKAPLLPFLAGGKKKTDSELQLEAAHFLPGAVVIHKSYGPGTITARSDGRDPIIQIHFNDGSDRSLLLHACLINKLLHLVAKDSSDFEN